MEEHILGLLAGILIGAAAVMIRIVIRRRRGVKNDEYDERQMALRGRAYQKAFFVLVFYLFLNAIICAVWGEWAQNGVDGLLGVFVAVGYFIVRCIRTDAYLALRQKAQYYQKIFAIVCVVDALSGYANWKDGGFLTDGLVNNNAIIPACGVMFLAALIALTIHSRRGGTENDGEDE